MNLYDDFERVNGPLGAGWTFGGAGTWAIVDGQAVHTAGAATDFAVLDAGESDVEVSTPLFGANTGLALRYIDADNTLMVVAGTGPIDDGLWKVVGGVASRIMATAAIAGNADLDALCVGDTVRLTVNDVIFGTHTMSAPEAAQFTTPTKFGLRAFSAGNQAHEEFRVTRYIGNVEVYPAPVDLDVAVAGLGINIGADAFQRWAYVAAKTYGATEIRWQAGWTFLENYNDPGNYESMDLEIVSDALGWCDELGLRPLLIAAYGPPYQSVMTVHVNGAHPIGSTSLTVTETVSGIALDVGSHYIAGTGIGRASYYGGIITGIPSAKVISLGAATTAIIADGATLTVNRLMYPSIATDSGTDPSAIAYANYVHALALRIAAHCPGGGAVELWNEPPWGNDSWDKRSRFYDDPVAAGVATWAQELSPIIKAVAGRPDWPASVEVYSSANNKSGGHSALNVLPKADLVPIVADEYHPYDIVPETHWWGSGATCEGVSWGEGYKCLLGGSSFPAGALIGDANGFRRRISECGYGGIHADPNWAEAQKSHAIRKLVGAWAMGFEMCNFYSLADGNSLDLASPVTHEPYPALVRLGQLMRFLREVQADEASYSLPTIRFYEGTLPLFRVEVGPVLIAWQRASTDGAPLFTPHYPATEELRITDVPGAELRVLNTVTRRHELASGPSAERRLQVGWEPLIVTWKLTE